MLRCLKCTEMLADPTELCNHLKIVHEMKGGGSYNCLLCNSPSDSLSKFRRHLELCFRKKKTQGGGEIENRYLRPAANENLQIYKDNSQKEVLEFVCKLSGNMSVPRNSVFEIIDDVKKLLVSITEGIKILVLPCVQEEKFPDVCSFISLINENFDKFDTEFKLDQFLSTVQLMTSLRTINLNNPLMEIDEWDDNDENEVDEFAAKDDGWEKSVYIENDDDECEVESNDDECEVESNDDECEVESNDDECEAEGADSHARKSETATQMPIKFQFKSFFELPTVFDKIKLCTEKIQRENKLNHYINGKSWKSKLKNFKKNDTVIPYHIYIDDTQLNNSLGTHKEDGNETCVYYTFPTIPAEYISRLDNIFPALLFPTRLSKCGYEKCFNEFINELNTLADEGITININGKQEKIFFVTGLVLGDNKGLNAYLGFTKCFRAFHYCRFCRLHKTIMRKKTEEVSGSLRNKENYEEDLRKDHLRETGLFENSVFNKLRYFHVTDNAADIMHDINEGIISYNVCEIILYFIKNKFFTLQKLNDEKRRMKYGELEENNKSSNIKRTHLNRKKLSMTASEAYSFIHHLPFLLGSITTADKREQLQNDEVWTFLLTTIRFFETSYLPCFDANSINSLRKVIASMHEMYMRLFNTHLKPKHHIVTHYPTLIENYGPLRCFSSIRFEAKHRCLKNYTKNTTSRRNVSHSVGRKFQYNFAYILINSSGLKDRFELSKPKITWINEENFYGHITPSRELDFISQQNVYLSEKVLVNGLKFSSKLYLPHVDGNQMQLFKIVKIIVVSRTDISSIRIIGQRYKNVSYCHLYASYIVDNVQSEMTIINIADVLYQRMFPVALHNINGLNMFRFKYF